VHEFFDNPNPIKADDGCDRAGSHCAFAFNGNLAKLYTCCSKPWWGSFEQYGISRRKPHTPQPKTAVQLPCREVRTAALHFAGRNFLYVLISSENLIGQVT
jgi:hypothetical protein